ncbi:DNA-formamidopyrimidine glycosylase [Phormidium sp. CCY1219]|uniref:DNA-formamidopyrimidine glycosylase n=1 Tax=Phormidium sp. CCY1219 TaxID=2886104 RepID=UPI002D1E71DA|nr:DNA-formamidopyrimidine glycosylase [Phormidium sp. CCY1219]MEB3829544.1 DNA-formamidopyrimidine glycosylase [Phormidium sp. CCY1219]
MPELPEVETVRRGLTELTLGETIRGGDVLRSRTIAHPVSAVDFLAALEGCAIAFWHRRGKYLLAQLHRPSANSSHTPGGWLGVHLRMSGQLLWLHPQEALQKHTRVRIFCTGDRELRFVDQRTFGKMWWVPPHTAPETIITGLAKLGPEPLSPDFSPDTLRHALHHRRRPIKTALLDQSIIAGLGNIYADEALFLSGIAPTQLCSDLTPTDIDRLHHSIIQVLQEAIAAGGTTFSNFLNLLGVNGNYAGVAWVYNRTGQPCRRCSTPIQRLKLAGRSTHFCPHCQPQG